MRLTKKTIAIFIEEQFQELEAWYPYYRFKEEGARVFFVAPQKGKEYRGKSGYPAISDRAVSEARVKDFDALVIPGGFPPDYMRRDPGMVRFVKDMHEAGKVVAAICHGGWMLASADIVKGKRVTVR